MTIVERGGSVGRGRASASDLAHAEAEGAAPGTEFRFLSAVESSSLGGRRPRARSAWRRVAIAAATGCLAVAAWNAGAAAWLHTKAALGQRLLSRAWDEAQAKGGRVKPWRWADMHPVARLVVPAHGIDLLVLSGANGRTLAWGPGHAEGTAAPGQRGNAVVTGHRDTHFAFLRDVEPGTRIDVQTPGGARQSYFVEGRFIADHRALKLPADDRATTLSLVTCYPFDAIDPGTPLRYAVVARAYY